MRAIREHPKLRLQVVVAASALLDRWGCVDLIEQEFEIDEKVYCVLDGDLPLTMASTTGVFMIQLASVLERLSPDIVLVHADRYEMLAVAACAKYMNFTLAHTQGGEVSGSIDHRVRNAISQLADIHFPATEMAEERLLKMGADPSRVFLVGCPGMDVIAGIDLTQTVDYCAKYGGVGPELDFSKAYIVVCQHPVTTEYGSGARQIAETLEAVRRLRMQTVWLWPNVDAGQDEISGMLRRFRETEKPDYVHFFKNLSPEDFARLLYRCSCLIGNTSAGIREGAFLGVPYVCVGTRQVGREHGTNVVFVNYDAEEIVNAAYLQMNRKVIRDGMTFGDGGAGRRIADILAEV